MMLLTRLKIVLQLALLGIFSYFFGAPSLVKYLDQKVIVSTSHHRSVSIPAPAVTFCAKDPDTKAWRDVHSLDLALNSCNASDNVFKCVGKMAWAREDVVLGAQKGYVLKKDLTDKTLWRSYFYKDFSCFTFESDIMFGTNGDMDELEFFLNNSLVYKVYVHSPTFFLQNSFPIFPNNAFKIIPSKDCNSYLQLTLTEQQELNSVEDPCEAAEGYSFTSCVEQSIARQVGCGLAKGKEPPCSTKEQYR